MQAWLGCWTALLMLLMCAIGCEHQPQTFQVHGMVVYSDGKPLTKGSIEFEALNQERPITASGQISANGHFQLSTYRPGDGAIAGKHRAAVIVDYDIGTGVERPDELPPPELDEKYRSFKTSGLEFEIERRMNNIRIEVERAPPPEKPTSAKKKSE